MDLFIKRTTIIATVGPSCSKKHILKEMVLNGVNIFRLNFSHGSHEEYKKTIALIREIGNEFKVSLGILGDLSGPKIRIGKVKNEPAMLQEGNKFQITVDSIEAGDAQRVSTNYKFLPKDVRINDRVLLDDGNITLKVTSKTSTSVNFEVIDGGPLKSQKGINLPGIPLSVNSISEKDKRDLKFILDEELDFVALSFVRSAECITQLKEQVKDSGIQVVAKIEKPEAVADLDHIIDASDVIMIARGDLGVEMPLQEVPRIQKRIIYKCFNKGKPVITATQMLESMIYNQRPTRAETTDVFNAIIDGSDAVMLSGETAAGKYPIVSVKTMSSIAKEAEKLMAKTHRFENIPSRVSQKMQDTTAYMACQSAVNLKAKAIVTFTKGGSIARRLSSFHVPLPVIALSCSERICRQISIYYGVIMRKIPIIGKFQDMVEIPEQIVKDLKIAEPGDTIVIVGGYPMGKQGESNLVKLHRVR